MSTPPEQQPPALAYASIAPRSTREKLWHLLVTLRMPVVLVLLVITMTILTGGLDGSFARPQNLINVARQISFEATVAFGMTLIIVTGGIDLSVGSLIALTGVVAAVVMRATLEWPPVACIMFGLAAGAGVGLLAGTLSGLVITQFSIPPFIVTLSMMLVARGVAFIACSGEPVYELPPELMTLGSGFLFERTLGPVLPIPVLVMFTAFAVFHVLLSGTVFGRGVIATGSNEEAARLAGIAVKRTRLIVYMVTGLLCGVVGVLLDGKLMAADPKTADMWELRIIAAVVVGGTSLFGGRGSILGTLIGALIIGVLNNSLNLLHVDHFWQQVVLGGVILLAAMMDVGLRRLGRK